MALAAKFEESVLLVAFLAEEWKASFMVVEVVFMVSFKVWEAV